MAIDIKNIFLALAQTEFTAETRPSAIEVHSLNLVDNKGTVINEGPKRYSMGGQHPLGGRSRATVSIVSDLVTVSVQVAPAVLPRGLSFAIPVEGFTEEIFAQHLAAHQKRRDDLMAREMAKADHGAVAYYSQSIEHESIEL